MINSIFSGYDEKRIKYILYFHRDGIRAINQDDQSLYRTLALHVAKSIDSSSIYTSSGSPNYQRSEDGFIFEAIRLNVDKKSAKTLLESNYKSDFRSNLNNVLDQAKRINPNIIAVVLKNDGRICDLNDIENKVVCSKRPSIIYGILDTPAKYLESKDKNVKPAISTFSNIETYKSLVLSSLINDLNKYNVFNESSFQLEDRDLEPKDIDIGQDNYGNLHFPLAISEEMHNAMRDYLKDQLNTFIRLYKEGELCNILDRQGIDVERFISEISNCYIHSRHGYVSLFIDINKVINN